MGSYEMVRASNLNMETLTFGDLRPHYQTGRAYTISGSGRDRKMGYRNGVMTNLGDIELSEWETLVKLLIDRSGEQELHAQLLQWVTENIHWLHTQGERKQEALQLHSMRIFDNPEWVDYIAFNQMYRPEILQQKERDHE